MRLRDRPRTLAEMKSDVDWPPALQAVMDRALARAPAERYATAPEFARALMDAMGPGEARSTVATPPTRVAAVTPTRVARAEPPPRAPERKSRAKRSRGQRSGSRRRGAGQCGAPRVAQSGRGPHDAVGHGSHLVDPNREPTPRSASTRRHHDRRSRACPTRVPGARRGPRPARPEARRRREPAACEAVERRRGKQRRARITGPSGIAHCPRQGRHRPRQDVRAARCSIPPARMVPRLEARNDIVELGVYSAAAYVLLGQTDDACLILESIGTEAEMMPKFTAQIQLWNERLDCKE